MPDGVTLSKSEGIVRSASETERLAFELSEVARIGDLLCLSGDLGVGKTTFARAFIRARGWRMGVEMDDVPSPTFTLAQVYELPGGNIWHFDLFRLENAKETIELGIDDAIRDGICLVEWPDRLPKLEITSRLDLSFEFGGLRDERRVGMVWREDWRDRRPELESS
jgi:tRNA threonylcarbamoyladenosine biosynthesis protein TsaE